MGYSFDPKTGLYTLTPTLIDGGLNLWDDATHLTHWEESIAGTSTVNREATEKIEGIYSCRLDIDASNSLAYIAQANVSLIPKKKNKLIVWYKNSLAGKTAKIQFKDSGDNVFLKEDGTWNVGSYDIILINSTVWKKFEVEFYAHPDYSDYITLLLRGSAASSSIYFDKLAIEEVVVDDGKILMVNSVIFIPTNADGDRLILTDYNGNKFVDIKGLVNEPNRIPFRKPRKLNGLKISTIDSGKAYVYLAQ